MRFGILGSPPGRREGRLLMTPRQAGLLDQAGARVFVEAGAGERAGLDDADWEAEGATLSRRDEVLAECDVVLSAARPSVHEGRLLASGSTLMGFLHLDLDGRDLAEAIAARGACGISLERVRTADGRHPFRERMAEVAGVVSAQLAARLLESGPGRGVLLGGVPGLPPTQVVVVGAGFLGRSAARAFSGAGASVLVLDHDLGPLELLEREGLRRVQTMLATEADVADAAGIADVLVGAVRVDGGSPPRLLNPFQGKPGAVWLDLSIDEGGCIEGARPVYSADEAYTIEGVTLCPVPNLSSWAARSASRLASALLHPVLMRATLEGDFDLDREPWLAAGAHR